MNTHAGEDGNGADEKTREEEYVYKWHYDIYKNTEARADYVEELGKEDRITDVVYVDSSTRVATALSAVYSEVKSLKTVLIWDAPDGDNQSLCLQMAIPTQRGYSHDWTFLSHPDYSEKKKDYEFGVSKITIHWFSCCKNGCSMRSKISFVGYGEDLESETYSYGPDDIFSRIFTVGTAAIVYPNEHFLFAGGIHPCTGLYTDDDDQLKFTKKKSIFQAVDIQKDNIKIVQTGELPYDVGNGRFVRNGDVGYHSFLAGIDGDFGGWFAFDGSENNQTGVTHKCKFWGDIYHETYLPSCDEKMVQSCQKGTLSSRVILSLANVNTHLITHVIVFDWDWGAMHSIGIHPTHDGAARAFAAFELNPYQMLFSLGCCDIVSMDVQVCCWEQIRLIWIGFEKNGENEKCFIRLLSKDVIKYLIRFCGHDEAYPLFGAQPGFALPLIDDEEGGKDKEEGDAEKELTQNNSSNKPQN